MTSRKKVILVAILQILSLTSTRVAGMMVYHHSSYTACFYYVFVTIILWL